MKKINATDVRPIDMHKYIGNDGVYRNMDLSEEPVLITGYYPSNHMYTIRFYDGKEARVPSSRLTILVIEEIKVSTKIWISLLIIIPTIYVLLTTGR